MIKKIDNIILLGTSHVAKQSAQEIRETIEKYNPEVVGIELDLERFRHLMNPNEKKKKEYSSIKTINSIGFLGFIFAKIAGFVQKTVGKSLNVDPGVDMKAAYMTARKYNIPVALIDQNVKTTLRKLSKLPFKRKVKLFTSLFTKGIKKENRKNLSFDVKKGVPKEETITQLLKIVQKEVPDLYNILIQERNVFMSKKLLKLKEQHEGKILAVVGAGHVEGMVEYLQKELNNSSGFSYSFRAEVEHNSPYD